MNDQISNPKILLWGPSGSGKTCLLNAFARELHFLSQNNHSSKYSLLDKRSRFPVSYLWDKEFSKPTTKAEDLDFVFTYNKEKPKPAIEHVIRVYEDRGDALVKALNQSIGSSVAISSFREATHIIALIDLTLITDSIFGKHLPKGRTSISKIEYLSYIQKLIDLAVEKTHTLNLALCLNKMDLSSLRWEDTETLIEIYLGSVFFKAIKNHPQKNINISFFATSAMGYFLDKEGFEHSNYNANNNGPLHEEIWQPWNVSAPFFWMFNQIESGYSKDSNILDFFRPAEEKIPNYPKPFY